MKPQLRDIDVLTVGESMALLTPPAGHRLINTARLELHVAGAESNVATLLAQLGTRAAWAGRVGADPLGQRVVAALSALGVDVSGVEVDPNRPTGVYFKDFDGLATNVYYYRSGSAATQLSAAPIKPLLRRARIVHLTGVTPALSPRCRRAVSQLMCEARRLGVTTSFDINYRPGLWDVCSARPVLTRLAQMADYVFTGTDEAERLWSLSDIDKIREVLPDVPTIVVKNGAIGATSYQMRGMTFVPAPRVEMVEPVGAGDAFAAGYLWGVLDNASETARLRRGHLTAAPALQSVADHSAPPPAAWYKRMCALTERRWRTLDLRHDPAVKADGQPRRDATLRA